MRSFGTHALVGVMALVVGFALASVLGGDAPEPAEPAVSSIDDETPELDEEEPQRRRRRGDPKEAAPTAEPADAAPPRDFPNLGASLTEQEVAYLRERLEEKRLRDAQAAEDAAELERIAATQSDLPGLDVLDGYLRGALEADDVISSFAAMRAHIRTVDTPLQRIESAGDETAVDLSKLPEDTAVLEFGAGTFVLDRGTSMWNTPRKHIASLEIRGAGMDRTTLIGPGWAFLCMEDTHRLENLVIRDLTIDAGKKEQIVLDARGGIAAALERVRLKNWPVAGHAAALGVSGDAFLAARDCEFLGDGWTLSLRGPALAVFERCTFVGGRAVLISSSLNSGRPARVHLNDCDFGSVPIAERELRQRGGGGALVTIRGGTARGGPASWTAAKRVEAFGATDVVSLKGLEFVSRPPTFSAEDLATALAALEAEGVRNVFGVNVSRPGVTPVELEFVRLSDDVAGATEFVARSYRNGRMTPLESASSDSRRRTRAPEPDDLRRIRSLSSLVRAAGLASDVNVLRAELRAHSRIVNGAREARLLFTIFTEGREQTSIDAVEGTVLMSR